MQIGSFALEEGMFFDVEDEVKIAGRAAERTGFAEAGKADASAVFHSCRNFGVNGFLSHDATLAFAFCTGIGNDATGALACGAGAGHAEESLLIAYLALSAASAATNRRFARGGARTAAVLASFVTPYVDFSFFAENRFFKFQSDVFAEVGTALGTAATTPACTKEIAKTEKVAKDLAEILEHCGIETGRSRSAYAGVPKAIVGGALIGIGKNGVSLTAFLEFLLRIRVVGIAVRMVLQG